MTRTVSALYRYPVKGLCAEPLSTVQLTRGCAFPCDRQLAIVHSNSQYQHDDPAWVTRRNFSVLAYSPALARLKVSFDESNRVLTVAGDDHSCSVSIDSDDVNDQLNRVLQSLNLTTQPGPFSLAKVSGITLTDSPEPLISLMNTRSLRDLATRTGFEIDMARFRGNVWFDGENPWEEREWPGKVMSVGGLQVRIVEEIVRCSAIDVHPVNGHKDVPLLNRLSGVYGHTHFGVLAEILQSGRLSVGSCVEETDTTGSLGI